MNFRTLFQNCQSRSRLRSRSRLAARRTFAAASLEQLEDRTLLAGNVTAQFLGQSAFINGDAADNSVQVLVDAGNVVVRGVNGTTVNGGTNDFVLATNTASLSRSVFASLSAGNDTFVINGVTVGRDLFVDGGAGNDLLVVSAANVGRSLMLWGGFGNDDIMIDASRVERDTNVFGWAGDDDIIIRNSTIVDDLSISGQSGQDVIHLDSIQVGDKSRLSGGGGVDNILIQGTSRFADRMRAVGGRGGDNIQAAGSVVFNGLKRRSFSGSVANAATISTRITNTTTGAIAAGEAAVQAASASASGQLSLSVNNATFSEAAGDSAATLTITRSAADTAADLVVTLSTTPVGQSKLSLAQTSVTILAGQTSANVAINAINDSAIDGNTAVTVRASATDLSDATVVITVTDDEVQTLTLTAASATFIEDTGISTTTGGPTVITVTAARNGDTTGALTLNLTSSDNARLQVPATVTIPAGQSEQDFTATTVPNQTVEASDLVVTLEATSANAAPGQLQLTLQDNDIARLTAAFDAPSISEDGTTQLRITRNTVTTSALTVSLTADDVSRFQFSSNTLTIPAGSASAAIAVSGSDNQTVDGDVTVGVIATATGFTNGESSIFVTDNDVGALTLTFTSGPNVEENAGAGAITASISRNIASPTTDLIVQLAATGDGRIVLPTSTVTIPAGQQSATFAFDVQDNQLVDATGLVATITASASGFVSSAATVTVTDDDIATLTLVPASSTVAENAGTTTLTITRNSVAAAETIALNFFNSSITGPGTVAFAVGQAVATVTLGVVNDLLLRDNPNVVITAQAPGRSDVTTTIAVTNDDVLNLTTDISSNVSVETLLARVTRDNSFTVSGFTLPGVTVQIESDGDGRFDEQSAVAATDGSYSFDIPLTNTAANNGLNVFQVRAIEPNESVEQISEQFLVHLAVGTVIRFGVNQDFNQDGTNEFFDVELLDTDAPNTVANFLSYVNDGSYNNLLAHRSPPGFVVQGGGFTVSNSVVSPVVARAAIAGEFDDASNSNIDGTLSMALTGAGPNSGTSGWFFNLGDNSGLDANKHTVFGRVIAGGIDVLRFINQNIDTIDLTLVTGQQGLLQNTPVVRSPLTSLSGTSNLTVNSNLVQGTGTLFTTELQVGSVIVDPFGQQLIVTSITSNTALTVDLDANRSDTAVPFSLLNLPADDDYVIFSSIGEILDQI